MNKKVSQIEKTLKDKSRQSVDDLLRYALFEMKSPIEDYDMALDILVENCGESDDIRPLILGAYLSSTWRSFEVNGFLERLRAHLPSADSQNKAIIYYLHAYDIYIRCKNRCPREYAEYLKKSVACSARFVYNFVRLAEVSDSKEALQLMEQAVANVEKVWTEEQLKAAPECELSYERFVDEFILGVDISSLEYNQLVAKRNSLGQRKG